MNNKAKTIKKDFSTKEPEVIGNAIYFVRYARSKKKLLILGLLLTVAVSAMGASLPLGGKALIDYVVMGVDPSEVNEALSRFGLSGLTAPLNRVLSSPFYLVLGMFVLGVLAGGCSLMQRLVMFRFQQETIYRVQSELFERLLQFPLSFFRNSRTGYLMSRATSDITGLQSLYSEASMQLGARALYACFGITVAFFLSPKLSVVLVLVLPVYVILNRYFTGRLLRASHDEAERSAWVTRDLQEVISGMETVKSHGAEEREGQRVKTSVRNSLGARMRTTALASVSEYASRALQFLTTLAVMLLGAYEMKKGTMSIGDYIAFTAYAVSVAGAVNGVSVSALMFQPALVAASRLRELFDISIERSVSEGLRPENVHGDISFEDVMFSYGDGTPALSNISFSVRRGRMLAITGPSGAGKTTAVNLLLKFYEPDKGSVRLDGQDIRELATSWLREQIAVVSQDVFLFSDTVKSNIRYGRPNASMDEVIRAAKLAHIHDEIEALPEGYETVVGERGGLLSAGQRQRISLARAFLRDPEILILDEPSAALDAESERMVNEAIRSILPEKTVIVIAHRMLSVAQADEIIVLDKGEIVERGTHGVLMEQDGLFRRLMGSSGA